MNELYVLYGTFAAGFTAALGLYFAFRNSVIEEVGGLEKITERTIRIIDGAEKRVSIAEMSNYDVPSPFDNSSVQAALERAKERGAQVRRAVINPGALIAPCVAGDVEVGLLSLDYKKMTLFKEEHDLIGRKVSSFSVTAGVVHRTVSEGYEKAVP